MHIAPLRRSDIEAAKRVIVTVVLEYYFDGCYTADELLVRYEKSVNLADLSRPEEEYGGTHGLLLGAFEGGAVVGTGRVRQFDTDSGELVRLWLLRNFRGRGIGRHIVGRLLQFARDAGWRRLRLDTSFRCKEAVSLFRKVGFCEIAPYKESIGGCFMELDRVVGLKLAVPFISVEKARKNLEDEMPGWDFDSVRLRAADS
jgi:putative acetyltransferase